MATSPRRPVVRRSLYGGLTIDNSASSPIIYLYPTPLTGATVKSPSAVSVVICIPEVDGNIGAHFFARGRDVNSAGWRLPLLKQNSERAKCSGIRWTKFLYFAKDPPVFGAKAVSQ